MKLLIKIGGTLLDQDESRINLARQLARLGSQHEVAVVHGGGKQLTRYLEERGVVSQFVNGLRVSDEPVIEGVTSVIAGGVNKRLVAALAAAGQRAIGLSGVDGGLTICRHLDPALGSVGEPIRSNSALLALLVEAGYLPVIACVAADEHGHIYNVNADRMAVSCAAAFRASKLVFFTDVPGVKGASGEVIPQLNPQMVSELVSLGVASGGMRAKLDAALLALDEGIPEIVIAPGDDPNVCTSILSSRQIGTRLSGAPLQQVGVAR